MNIPDTTLLPLTPQSLADAYPRPSRPCSPPVEISLAELLESVEDASPVEGVEVLARALASSCGAREVHLLIAEIDGKVLLRLRRDGAHPPSERSGEDAVPIEDTPAGAALRTQEVQLDEHAAGVSVYAPVTARGEALGVLECTLPAAPGPALLREIRALAHTLAYVVIADRRFTDVYEAVSAHTQVELAAEIQRQLLPLSYACEAAELSLAGWLVPASSAGGDTFDYALSRDHLHLSITDAMGHGVNAALLATLTVASLRNSRRQRLSLTAQARGANAALLEHSRDDQFVTGQLLALELATGRLEIVNAGHLTPLLLRDGALCELPLRSDPALGILDGPYELQHTTLQPGDRLVLLTDGMLERDAEAADIRALLPQLSHLHPREAVQHCTRAVVSAAGGALEDDATILVLDWHGPSTSQRTSQGGSDSARASN